MKTEPAWEDDDGHVRVYIGDCLKDGLLADLADGSVDAVVTDPPYELGFMGRSWDRSGIAYNVDMWRQVLRVLRPGGHMLAFGGTRTWHRLVCAVEDAGFEIRDSIAWLYGSGFAKSLNLDNLKASPFCQCRPLPYDHEAASASAEYDVPRLHDPDVPQAGRTPGRERSLLLPGLPEQGAPDDRPAPLGEHEAGAQPGMEGRRDLLQDPRELHGSPLRAMPAGIPGDGAGGRLHHGAPAGDGAVGRPLPDADGGGESYRPQPVEQLPLEPRPVADERGPQARRSWPLCGRCGQPRIPAGLGTALKPAHEPIVVARKPLDGTVAGNVLVHGTGALNIDACRIEGVPPSVPQPKFSREMVAGFGASDGRNGEMSQASGRWPANVTLDGEMAAELDKQTGVLTSGDVAGSARHRPGGNGLTHGAMTGVVGESYADSGGASRFFPVFRYEPKAPSSERPRGDDGSGHATVKPLELMRWLVRLVTPPGGLVLDPFLGSGTTAEACYRENMRCIGFEQDPGALPWIRQRLDKPHQSGLF